MRNWTDFWRIIKALGLLFALAAGGAAHAQTFDSSGPVAPSGASPPISPLIGCVYVPATFTLPSSLTGRALTCDSTGALRVTGGGGGGGGGAANETATNATDAQATRADNQHSVVFAYGFNGSTWDRARVGAGGAWLTIINSALPAGTNLLGKVGIDQTTPGTTNGVQVTNPYSTTTSGALEPPTAASGKMVPTTGIALSANTNTQLLAANTNRIALSIQCGVGGVVISETGATLTSGSFGVSAGQTVYIPSASQPYYSAPIVSRTAITAYTATAQTCVPVETSR